MESKFKEKNISHLKEYVNRVHFFLGKKKMPWEKPEAVLYVFFPPLDLLCPRVLCIVNGLKAGAGPSLV